MSKIGIAGTTHTIKIVGIRWQSDCGPGELTRMANNAILISFYSLLGLAGTDKVGRRSQAVRGLWCGVLLDQDLKHNPMANARNPY